MPKPSDWEYAQQPAGEPGEGEVLVKVLYLSLDPAMRGWMNDARSYIPPVGIGEVMRALGAGEVIASRHPDLAVGDHVTGLLGAQEYAVVHGGGLIKVDTALAPLPVYLGALGMPGMTAYFGLLDIGRPQEGETVVVSGAAGAVEASSGRSRSSRDVTRWGSRAASRSAAAWSRSSASTRASTTKPKDAAEALARHCPKGIDVYFDNVGGDILDAALVHLARHARVIVCGAISQYNSTSAVQGPSNYLSLLVNHASMTGFVVSDDGARYAGGGDGDGGLAGLRKARLPGGHRGRIRELPGHPAATVSRREHGQARPQARGGLTPSARLSADQGADALRLRVWAA